MDHERLVMLDVVPSARWRARRIYDDLVTNTRVAPKAACSNLNPSAGFEPIPGAVAAIGPAAPRRDRGLDLIAPTALTGRGRANRSRREQAVRRPVFRHRHADRRNPQRAKQYGRIISAALQLVPMCAWKLLAIAVAVVIVTFRI